MIIVHCGLCGDEVDFDENDHRWRSKVTGTVASSLPVIHSHDPELPDIKTMYAPPEMAV